MEAETPPTPMDALVVRDLRKTFAETRALKGISFTVHSGEVFSLLGPNGAGKTTALRLIMGLLTPDSGSVEVLGENPRARPEIKREIGYLTADMGLYARLSPRETLRFYGRIYGLSGRAFDERLAEVMARLGIGPFADKRCESLSTGMKQRVLLARALLPDPRVLVLDEPTSGLDAATALEVIDLLKQERATGKAILFSTHQLWEAEILADRVGILHEGALCACGTSKELLEQFQVASLLALFLKIVHGDEPAIPAAEVASMEATP